MTSRNFMLAQAAELRKAASLLAKSADAMAERRKAAMSESAMEPGEFKLSILHENAMRDAVNSMLMTAIDAAINGVKGSQADLESAILDATAVIKTIDDIKQGLKVFVVLIVLAQAIVKGEAGEIIKALESVKIIIK